MILSTEGFLSAGDEISSEEFLSRLSSFFHMFEEDVASPRLASPSHLTSLLATLTRVTVTFDEEQRMGLADFQDKLEIVAQRVEIAITFYQEQFEALTGVTATETQMKVGDPSVSLSAMSVRKINKLKSLTKNKYLVEKVRMLWGAIAEDAVDATSSGTMEMTLEELKELVMEFFDMIYQDFLASESCSGSESTFANDLVIKIQSAKLTEALVDMELTMVDFFLGRLVNLEGELEATIQVFLFQYNLVSGNSLEIEVNEVPCEPCEPPSTMMTTRNPMITTRNPMMTTRNPGSMMTTQSSMMMTTKSHSMMTTKSHEMMTTQSHAMTTMRPSTMTTGRPSLMMTTRSPGLPTNQVDVEVCVKSAPWGRSGLYSKRREWLKNAMKNAFKKHF